MYENEITECTETLYKSKGLHSVIFFETEKL